MEVDIGRCLLYIYVVRQTVIFNTERNGNLGKWPKNVCFE